MGTNSPEIAPEKGEVNVWPLVIADMKERDLLGKNKYGTALKTVNGRNPLIDAYQEALDL
jgi:hypothetical protein